MLMPVDLHQARVRSLAYDDFISREQGMDIKNLLVSAGPDAPPNVLACAISMAERFRATITGVGVAEPSIIFVDGPAGVAAYESARADTEEALTQAKLDFEARVPRNLVARWVSGVQNPTAALRRESIDTDLVIAGFGLPGRETDLDVGEVVLTVGRPVLVLAGSASSRIGTKLLVAWKDGREARRAVADALPVLRGAELVRVVTVDEGEYARERLGLDRILEWLRSHDVAATGEVLPMVSGGAADAILNAAAALDVDLVVAGAYGHSRLREWMLGGMTRDLLTAGQVSLLLSN